MILTVVIPLSTTVSIVVDWLVVPEFKQWEIYCYSYTCILVHLHIAVWFTMCCSVASTAHQLMNMLQQVKTPIFSHNCIHMPQNKEQEVMGRAYHAYVSSDPLLYIVRLANTMCYTIHCA
jgi:hypothetical protein